MEKHQKTTRIVKDQAKNKQRHVAKQRIHASLTRNFSVALDRENAQTWKKNAGTSSFLVKRQTHFAVRRIELQILSVVGGTIAAQKNESTSCKW